jgi:glycosyltransferase involved in cell wall biosynthesis
MRLIFVSYTFWPPDFGGELLTSIERFETLARRGHHITVLTAGHPGYPQQGEQQSNQILRSPVIGRSRLALLVRRWAFWAWSLAQLARRDYQVMHWHDLPNLRAPIEALMAWSLGSIAHMRRARTVTVRALGDSQDVVLDLRFPRRWLKRLMYSQTDRVVAVSPGLYRPLAEWLGPRARLITPCPRDDLFRPLATTQRTDIRCLAEAGPEIVVFTFVGRASRRKGFDVLAKAFASLAADHPNWRLWIIGPLPAAESRDTDRRIAEEAARPLSACASQVRYWGRVNDRARLAELLGASDAFVLPSRWEGFPLSPMEAMAAGVPVVISAIPGFTTFVNVEGVTGYYVPPGEVAPLQAALQRLGASADLRRRLGAAAHARIQAGFTWNGHVDAWEKLYTAQG